MKPVIIIPAYNPDKKLIAVVEKLYDMGLQTVVVNDGSPPEYDELFDKLKFRYQCDVCRQEKNRGKGAALKTGILYAALNYPETIGFVTADADGQHLPEDIIKVARSLQNNPDSLILGIRNFSNEDVPLKSLLGNRITSLVYWLSTGARCSDTQTGLRGIPKKFRTLCLSIPGERYEFEMNMLLEMAHSKIPFINVPIETVYLENNNSSHFHPIRDSVIIYYNILKYSLSSLVSAAADLSLFTFFVHIIFGSSNTGILASTAMARLMSGGLNFTLNKYWVFNSKKRNTYEALMYFVLFCCQMLLSWLLVSGLSSLPISLTLIKIFVDTGLFFINYLIQRNFIFNPKKREAISQ